MLTCKGLEPPPAPSRRRYCAAIGLFLFILFTRNAAAEGIEVEHAGSELVGGMYQLDARIRFDFGEEILVALRHGVELNIEVVIRARRERKWLWDPIESDQVLKFRLQHHPLSNDYVVTDLNGDVAHQFASEAAAIRFLGMIQNRPFLALADVREDSVYTGYVRAKLNIDLLPPPLQPAAYASKEWRLQSPWYEWVIRQAPHE